MADSNIARFFLVEDKNDSGLARDLVNSGAIPQDIVPAGSEDLQNEVCPHALHTPYVTSGTASALYQR
jgi:hypothetical protein